MMADSIAAGSSGGDGMTEAKNDVDRLHEMVSKHTEEIHELKMDNSRRDNKMDILTGKVENMNVQFADLKTAVHQDGSKTRESMDKVTEKLDKNNERLWAFIEKQEEYEQGDKSRQHEEKATKMKTFKDIAVGIFALLGSIMAGSIGFQEISRLFQ